MQEDDVDVHYRPINLEFLNQASKEHFDLFYRTESFGSITFVKFASSRPEHHEKVLRLLESGDCEETFYINEEDLFKYYQQATQSLRTIVTSTMVPLQVKTKKVYEVSKGIMKEFFDYNTSPKILDSSDEVMAIMDDCMAKTEVGFSAISQITNKDYYTYTHSVNVGLYCMTFAVKCKMKKADIKQFGLGGMLHDVGKSKINADLINKSGKLTEQEFLEMQKHSPLGETMLVEMQHYLLQFRTPADLH